MIHTDEYPLEPFRQADRDKLCRVIRAWPLAAVISQGEPLPLVTQVPLELDVSGTRLQGHFDRRNPHCERILAGGDIYCLFSGPNHYMSPSIYPEVHYPGWNYVAVHVHGRVRPVSDAEWLQELLLRIAERHEPADSGYRLTPSQRNFDILLTRILGFEIEIDAMEGIFKLAQDKGPANAERARLHLAEVLRRDTGGLLKELLEAPSTASTGDAE